MEQKVSQPQDQNTATETRITAGMWIRTILVIVILPAVILFGAAGTFEWPMAWLYIGLSVVGFAISRVNEAEAERTFQLLESMGLVEGELAPAEQP